MQKALCNGSLCRSITKTLSACTRVMAEKKTLLAMKLTAMILLIACLQASADGFSQTVTISVKDAPLDRVFEKIKTQTGYTFVYTRDMLRKAKRVTLTVNNAPLELVLQLCFAEQPLSFTVLNEMIVVKEKERQPGNPAEDESRPPPPIDVRGRIVNEKGDPVIVTVSVKGSGKITGTDENGFFELKDIVQNAVLIITGVGIETREVTVRAAGVLPTITVKIKTTPMDELQVIAYGVTSKRFVVGAVTTIKSDVIDRQPVNNVFLALQGRVPGLVISAMGGAPGTTVKMQIRGQNTLPNGASFGLMDEPLIIIDGVPFSPQNKNINLLSSLGTGSSGASLGFGALSSINPNDIESITVLRDADATSIYGSQGANGVILITTKKGVPGKTTFTTRINTGPNKTTRRYEYLKTAEYLELRREAIANDGLTLPPAYDGQYPDLQLFDTTKYTDWFDRFFGGTSNNTDIQTSLTGGSDNISFIVSAGYNISKYNFPGDFAEKRVALHSGFHYQSKNNKLGLDFTTDFSYNRNNNAMSPSASATNGLPPNTPELLDEAGNLIWDYKGLDFGFNIVGNSVFIQYQHYAYLKQPYNLRKYNLNNSLQLTYKLFAGLSAIANIGYSRFTSSENSQYPIGSQSPNAPYGREGAASFGKNEYETFNVEPQLNYQRNIGKGVLTLLTGATYKRNFNESQLIEANGYTNDGFLNSLTGAGRIATAVGNTIIYKYVGVYGRVGYIHDKKYIVNITGRRDGSSNFGPGRQYGTFASAGAGWIVSEENFFAGAKPTFSLFKFSANYGTNGSDGVEPYSYQEYWTSSQNFGANFMGIRPYSPLNLYNPDYSWATKRTLNLMLDLGFFNDRLLFNINWYHSRTGNQLVGVILPSQTGFSSVNDNFPALVQNRGLELSITSTNVRSAAFSWTTNFVFSVNRNKLVAFPDLDKSAYFNTYEIGKSLNMVYLFPFRGVNMNTGLFEFSDAKGNPTYSPNFDLGKFGGDRTVYKDLQPGFNGGIDNSFSYKGFSLSVFFQFAKQNTYNHLMAMYSMGYFPGMHGNVPVLIRDRWHKQGDKATYQRVSAGNDAEVNNAVNNLMSSEGVFGDASYLRLKNLSIAYDFPASFIKKAGMESLKLYASAQNLLTFTPYKFGDPEVAGNLTIPLQRTIALGLLFNF